MEKRYKEAKKYFAELRRERPQTMKGFIDFIHGLEKEGALSPKIKQIISVAISVIKQCEWCIAYHTFKALEHGATKEELMDACFVASFFGGGTAMMYTHMVLDAIKEYNEKNISQ